MSGRILTLADLPRLEKGLRDFAREPNERTRQELELALSERRYRDDVQRDLPSAEKWDPQYLPDAKLPRPVRSVLVKLWRAIRTHWPAERVDEAVTLAEEALRIIGSDSGQAVYLGEGKLQVGKEKITLEDSEESVIAALVQLGTCSHKELARISNVNDAGRVLKRITEKHKALSDHIKLPRKRGAGGYSTTIESAQQ